MQSFLHVVILLGACWKWLTSGRLGHGPKRELSQERPHCRWFLPRMQSSRPPSFPKVPSIAKRLRMHGIGFEQRLGAVHAKCARLPQPWRKLLCLPHSLACAYCVSIILSWTSALGSCANTV